MSGLARSPFAILVAVIVIGFTVWKISSKSDQDQIHTLLNTLEADLYLSSGENKIEYAARMKSLTELFTEPLNLDIESDPPAPKELNSRSRLKTALLSLPNRVSEFRIEVNERGLILDRESDSAKLRSHLRLFGKDSQKPFQTPVIWSFVKTSEGWKISGLETLRPFNFQSF